MGCWNRPPSPNFAKTWQLRRTAPSSKYQKLSPSCSAQPVPLRSENARFISLASLSAPSEAKVAGIPDDSRPLPLIATYEQECGSLRWDEEVLRELMRHFCPQDFSLNNGVVIVEARINTRLLYFIQQLARVVECMRSVRNQAIHRKLHMRCAEIALQNGRHRAGHAAVRSRILRVGGRRCQRRPQRIARQCGITTSRSNSSYRPPKAK